MPQLTDFKSAKAIGPHGFFSVMDQGGNIGLFSAREQRIIIPCDFESIGRYRDNDCWEVTSEKYLVGIYNVTKASLVVPTIHTDCIEVTPEYVIMSSNYRGPEVRTLYTSKHAILVGPRDLVMVDQKQIKEFGCKTVTCFAPEDFTRNPHSMVVIENHLVIQWIQDLKPQTSISYFKAASVCIDIDTSKIVKEW